MLRFLVGVCCAIALSACQSTGPGAATAVKSVTSSDGVSISYQISGRGRPAIVFIHGWLCDRTYWREQIPVFEQTHRVIALDLAGHGESERTRDVWTMQAFGEDVAAVVRAERLSRVVLVGHSMGGPVMLAAAEILGDRVAAVIGVDTLPDVEQFVADARRMALPGALESRTAAMHVDYYGTIRGFINTMFLPKSDPALRSDIMERMTAGPKDIGIAAVEAMLTYDPTSTLEKITPNRYLINRGKPMGGSNEQSASRNGFELTVIDNVGHFIMLEKPAQFNEALADTLRQIR